MPLDVPPENSFPAPPPKQEADPADFQRLAETAKKLVLMNPDLRVLQLSYLPNYPALSHLLQEHIDKSDAGGHLLLPDLRAYKNETVAVFSDYSGEGPGGYRVYSVLVCGLHLAQGFFNARMRGIRAAHSLGIKEIAFKDFRMGQIRRALPDYLEAMNAVPGFLFTLVVDKKVRSVLGLLTKADQDAATRLLSEHGFGSRKPEELEKVLRIVHLVSFLTGLLAHDGQKIFWMTDHDAISANEGLHRATLRLFQNILGIYTRPDCHFPLVGGAVPFAERHLDTLDLLSITDVVAGALNEYLSQGKAMPAAAIRVKEGSDRVLQWLAGDGFGLKKMVVRVTEDSAGTINGGTLEFVPTKPQGRKTCIGINPGPATKHRSYEAPKRSNTSNG